MNATKIPTYTFIHLFQAYTFISFQEIFPPILLFSPIFLLVFQKISHLCFYLDSSSIRNYRVMAVTFFKSFYATFLFSWENPISNFIWFKFLWSWCLYIIIIHVFSWVSCPIFRLFVLARFSSHKLLVRFCIILSQSWLDEISDIFNATFLAPAV